MSGDTLLESAILQSLEGLLRALQLEPLADGRFRAPCEPARFDRVFGGQVLAQAVLAATATVTGKEPHSVHAAFVEAGLPGEDVELVVDCSPAAAPRAKTVVQQLGRLADTCPHCGAKFPVPLKFCGQCGKAMA